MRAVVRSLSHTAAPLARSPRHRVAICAHTASCAPLLTELTADQGAGHESLVTQRGRSSACPCGKAAVAPGVCESSLGGGDQTCDRLARWAPVREVGDFEPPLRVVEMVLADFASTDVGLCQPPS